MHHRILASAVLIIGALAASVATMAVPAAAAPAHTAPAVQSAATAVRLHAEVDPAYPLRCVVTASNVNYRSGPGTQYSSYGQLARRFAFASDGGVINPRNRYQYWNNVERPGHADAYVDAAYVYCWLA